METKLCCCTETHLNRSFSAAYFSVTLVASFFEYKFESSTRPFSRLSFIKYLNGFLYSLTFLLLLLMFLTLSPHPATLFSSGANHVIFSSFFSCSLHTHTHTSLLWISFCCSFLHLHLFCVCLYLFSASPHSPLHIAGFLPLASSFFCLSLAFPPGSGVLTENSAYLQLACAPAIRPDKARLIRPLRLKRVLHIQIHLLLVSALHHVSLVSDPSQLPLSLDFFFFLPE